MYICYLNNEKLGTIHANSYEEALQKAIKLYGLTVDIYKKDTYEKY